MDYQEYLINAKYHLSVVERMFESYEEIKSKRFIIGIINEMAKSASNLIKAFLIYEKKLEKNPKRNIKIFMKKGAIKYLDKETTENILKSLEIERAQKISPIEYSKDDKIILLINGKYRFLTVERLMMFTKSIKKGISKFPGNFRQI